MKSAEPVWDLDFLVRTVPGYKSGQVMGTLRSCNTWSAAAIMLSFLGYNLELLKFLRGGFGAVADAGSSVGRSAISSQVGVGSVISSVVSVSAGGATSEPAQALASQPPAQLAR